LKLIAVATTSRNPKIPDVPTFSEAGIKDFEFAPWVGLTGPAGMPEPVVQRLTDALAKVMAGDQLARKIRDVGLVPTGSTSKQFTAFAASELENYRTLIQERKISLGE
jgi:tripartite-type tricarboxylate transporter receptor subunit TctC